MPQFNPTRPYNGLPFLPPRADIETKAILKKCIKARAALAELKQAGELIPNQDVLINTIPLREAKDSSEIENIVTTTDKLFEYAAMDGQGTDPHTKEALRYRTALYEGYRNIKARPLSTLTAVRTCQIIKNVDLDIRNTPGTALLNDQTEKIIYTPPEGQDLLRGLLGNWEGFLHDEQDIDPLIRMAVGHYQFEAIHPFTDGNGRTGRILNILFLIGEDLLNIPVLYLSRYIIEHRPDYYRLLLEVTSKKQWEQWILYILAAVEETAKWTTAKIRIIRRLMDHTREHVNDAAANIYSRELVEVIFVQPYCGIRHIVDAGIAERATASKYLRILCDAGVLRSMKIGRRKLFLHPKFLKLLLEDKNDFELYGR